MRMGAKVRKDDTTTIKIDDWFSEIDEELEKRKVEVSEDFKEVKAQRAEVNRNLISDFWKIWTTFNRNGIHFSMEPNYYAFAQFDDFPYGTWRFKPGFSLEAVNTIQLTDTTHDQGRVGDSLRAFYSTINNKENLRIIFEYCEGEHYYKYSGWKRIYSQHILYESPLDKVELNRIHELFKKIVRVWFESHLKRDRELFLNYLRKNHERLQTFAQ